MKSPDTEAPDASRRLLDALTQVHVDLVTRGDHRALFERLLALMLEETRSEYGFIGEILRTPEGAPYLRTYAITNIAWTDELRAQYAANVAQGMEFRNLQTLFGAVLCTGQPVLTNTPASHPRAAGVPPGHPPLRAFLGVPFKVQGEMVGMAGVANRPGGYDEGIIDFLQPLLTTCGIITRARRAEQSVKEHTRELQAKNEELARVITRLQETQRQLVAQERLASLGTLTAGIAHELKNPLHFIDSFSELSEEFLEELAKGLAPEWQRMSPEAAKDVGTVLARLQQMMPKIRAHGSRAALIIDGMLMHSRGASEPRVPANLHAVLEESLQLACRGFCAKVPGFEPGLQLDFDPGVSDVELAVSDVSRAFINMVDNACYALHQKQRQHKEAFSPRLEVSTRDRGERVEVRIRDNGIGIPGAHLGKVFDPFFTTKSAGQGVGLGLSLSHDIIVGRHQGSLHVSSVEGEFTELVIELLKHAPSVPSNTFS